MNGLTQNMIKVIRDQYDFDTLEIYHILENLRNNEAKLKCFYKIRLISISLITKYNIIY